MRTNNTFDMGRTAKLVMSNLGKKTLISFATMELLFFFSVHPSYDYTNSRKPWYPSPIGVNFSIYIDFLCGFRF